MPSRTIDDVLRSVPLGKPLPQLPAPHHRPLERKDGACVGLAVESMRRHTTDEGSQLFEGLEHADWSLAGHDFIEPDQLDETCVRCILNFFKPSTVLVQDQREWEGLTADKSRDPAMRFHNVKMLAQRQDVFTGTVLKDAHQQPEYHRSSAEVMGCHFWVCYYHSRIVHHLAPWTRPQHLVRTWHSVDAKLVPELDRFKREGSLLSGALSSAYPLRQALFAGSQHLPKTHVLRHPGYHRNGCQTPEYLKLLSQHKVAICTSSIYGYALRKIIEATACGCIVLTDMPVDEVLPEIDGNLVRITPDFTAKRVGKILAELHESWDADRQRAFAEKAKAWYDFRAIGKRLSDDIETLRQGWNS